VPSSRVPATPGSWPVLRQLAVVAVGAGLGWLAIRGLTGALHVRAWDRGAGTWVVATVGAVAALLVAGCVPALLLRSRPPGAVPAVLAPLLVSVTSATTAGLATAALHGTRWSFNALYSDAGFRTEAATRFADSPALADYGYRGLPSYYPPVLPWVEGRLAALLGIPAWTAMKPVTLVVALLVPVLAYVLWRRLLPDLTAAAVVALTSLTTADLVKPDEWLVLALVLPWWLELVRDLRHPGVRRLPAWGHGLILGALLLVHSFYFVPLALATLVGVVLDAVAGRPMPLRPGRAVAVAAVGLLCASPYWVPLAVLRLQGAPADNLQRRWSPGGFEIPPLPLSPDAVGLLGLCCVAWLVHRRGTAWARALTVALGTSYAFFVGGQLLQPYGVAVLPEKADELIKALLVVGGALAVRDLMAAAVRRRGTRATVLVTVLALLAGVPAVVQYAAHSVAGRQARTALHMRYPDGSFPAGGPPVNPATTRHPWGVSPLADEPSTRRVVEAWTSLDGRAPDGRTVLLTARADLLATTPVHPFTAWKSIYSHPEGQFLARLQLLRRVSRCGSARCAWLLLRDNRFDRVDGAVLTRASGGLRLALTTDTFPDAWQVTPVVFPARLFARPYFERRYVGDVAVIRLSPRPPG
jgi:galactan 5-O-arabinofuranosyltransferase